ncbi:MAG: NADH-quinone oxidoreductase subunit J [Deferribacterota bacterium]|nr:NADH-quinone oxidoreductase subunit J [Deferribacterota bacterium]
MEKLAFYLLSIIILVSSIFMITRRNLVHSILWMLLTFFCVAGIFIQLNAEFIAAIQVIVYAGAILVLYLFVVMLLNPKATGVVKVHLSSSIIVFVILILVVQIMIAIGSIRYLGEKGQITAEKIAEVGNVKLFGGELFTNYVVPFEIAAVMLLIAMIGAIVIALRK